MFIEELKNLPETQISFKEELLDRFMGKYTKLDAVRGTNIHRDIVRFQLTKNLGMHLPMSAQKEYTLTGMKIENLFPQMKEEADLALKNSLSSCDSTGTWCVYRARNYKNKSKKSIDDPFCRLYIHQGILDASCGHWPDHLASSD